MTHLGVYPTLRIPIPTAVLLFRRQFRRTKTNCAADRPGESGLSEFTLSRLNCGF